jgi:hypothetical protein
LTAARSYVETDSLIADAQAKGFSAGKYEININYLDALDRSEKKMLTAHSLLLSIRGVPAIYYHSFFGSYGIKVAGRQANRAVMHYDTLMESLGHDTVCSRINTGIRELLSLRNKYISGFQRVEIKDGLLVVHRESVVCVHNFTSNSCSYPQVYDLVSQKDVSCVPAFSHIWHLRKDL